MTSPRKTLIDAGRVVLHDKHSAADTLRADLIKGLSQDPPSIPWN
jgi:hypothetical protein